MRDMYGVSLYTPRCAVLIDRVVILGSFTWSICDAGHFVSPGGVVGSVLLAGSSGFFVDVELFDLTKDMYGVSLCTPRYVAL